MKVKEVMTPNPTAIWLTESLADAAKLMWDNDCGVLPVIKDGRKVVGMITDRDICMATAIRDSNPSAISLEEVMSPRVRATNLEDEIVEALETMKAYKLRRLPVVNAEGELAGILSMNDVVLKAKETDGEPAQAIDYADVVETYQAICQHPVQSATAATPAT